MPASRLDMRACHPAGKVRPRCLRGVSKPRVGYVRRTSTLAKLQKLGKPKSAGQFDQVQENRSHVLFGVTGPGAQRRVAPHQPKFKTGSALRCLDGSTLGLTHQCYRARTLAKKATCLPAQSQLRFGDATARPMHTSSFCHLVPTGSAQSGDAYVGGNKADCQLQDGSHPSGLHRRRRGVAALPVQLRPEATLADLPHDGFGLERLRRRVRQRRCPHARTEEA